MGREERRSEAAVEGGVELRSPALEAVPVRTVAATVVFRGSAREPSQEVVGGR